MASLRNILALLGLLTVIVLVYAAVQVYPTWQQLRQFDDGAVDVYREMMGKLMETGNAADATVWKVQVDEGLSAAEVEEIMKFVANEHNIKNVGELPLFKQVEAMSGKPYRFVKIFMFCNALTAAKMMDYSDAFTAYLPCRITLLEDKKGRLWIYTLNMDMMIHGGRRLPDEIRIEAEKVKMTMLDIMNRTVQGRARYGALVNEDEGIVDSRNQRCPSPFRID